MNRSIGILGFILVLGGIIASTCLFTVRETEQALVLRFGEIRSSKSAPGLHFKMPWPIEEVRLIDKRILDLNQAAQEVIAADQKRLVVDSFARFRILDPRKFFETVNNEFTARQRLDSILDASMRRVLGAQTFETVLSGERAALMLRIRNEVNSEASRFGIDIVDVRIRRADLPEQNSQAIYQRMQTERQREAAEFRARGEEQALSIRADADRQATILIATANRDSEIIRGQGDGARIATFAEAFGRDPEFFSFYRTMGAYENALSGDGTTMILSPDSDFFRYFSDPLGGRRTGETSDTTRDLFITPTGETPAPTAPATTPPSAPATEPGAAAAPDAN